MLRYSFSNTLVHGLIKSRPNRFIMWVEVNGELEKCHCPSTGRIGKIDFKDIPCLLSKSNVKNRKTNYTVEAIYPTLNNNIAVGINQVKANTYINYFLENNLLPNMVEVMNVRREVYLKQSKIDFYINENCYLEVKPPSKTYLLAIKRDVIILILLSV